MIISNGLRQRILQSPKYSSFRIGLTRSAKNARKYARRRTCKASVRYNVTPASITT